MKARLNIWLIFSCYVLAACGVLTCATCRHDDECCLHGDFASSVMIVSGLGAACHALSHTLAHHGAIPHMHLQSCCGLSAGLGGQPHGVSARRSGPGGPDFRRTNDHFARIVVGFDADSAIASSRAAGEGGVFNLSHPAINSTALLL